MGKRSSGAILKDLLIALDKMSGESEKEDTIDVNSMYGVFLSEYNKFIICKEHNLFHSEYPSLNEFFTGELVVRGHNGFNGGICHWRKGGKVYLDGINFSEMGFCVPLTDLLRNVSINALIQENDIACLYANVNKYIRENPNFIYKLMETEKIR